MMLSANNLKRAEQVANLADPRADCTRGSSSYSWIARTENETVAIWANDPEKKAGTLTQNFYEDLKQFLDLVSSTDCNRVILFIDSAGVALDDGWQGMTFCADLIKRLLKLSIHSNIPTIAVLGEQMGCYGGAYLIASACEYVIGSPDGRYGVSGKRVIEQVSGSRVETSYLFYQASYRLLNKELFCLLPQQKQQSLKLLLMLNKRALNKAHLLQDIKLLVQDTEEDYLALTALSGNQLPTVQQTESLGFEEPCPIGCDELLEFIRQLAIYLDNEDEVPVIKGNCMQAFSFVNEQRGFSRYLALCMKLIRYLAETGRTIRIEVDNSGTGATFIALTMMADQLDLKTTSRVYPLPPDVVEQFVPGQTLNGQEWRHCSQN